MSIRFLTKTYQFSRKKNLQTSYSYTITRNICQKYWKSTKLGLTLRETYFTVVYLEVKAFICISDSSQHF